ncbi:SDR family oxidoreductase [Microdochium nivale]|nr:SDR family oxidoreductase [Microdochium nivale]
MTDTPKCIALTGASTLPDAYFVHRLLKTDAEVRVVCLAKDSKQAVLDTLEHRIAVLPGDLRHPTLGLGADDIACLDADADAIYSLASDMSLFGSFRKLVAGNLGALRFLINLGTVHLQSWHDTTINTKEKPLIGTDGFTRDEQALSHITPGAADGSLAYLKIRWACEALLHNVASAEGAGLPVVILRGSLQTGLVPDFGGASGGGMSWVTYDFVAAAVKHLTLDRRRLHADGDVAASVQIWHVVPPAHVTYRAMARLLGDGLDGYALRPVAPDVWFAALRA